jgi:hypothetical protein
MKVIYIGLSDRIGPSTVDICKRMMLLNTKLWTEQTELVMTYIVWF